MQKCAFCGAINPGVIGHTFDHGQEFTCLDNKACIRRCQKIRKKFAEEQIKRIGAVRILKEWRKVATRLRTAAKMIKPTQRFDLPNALIRLGVDPVRTFERALYRVHECWGRNGGKLS